MNKTQTHVTGALLSLAFLLAPAIVGADVIEQILVKVNGEIFTKTDLETRQVAALRQRNVQGEQNDEQLRQALGIAEYHGPRSQMMREIAHPTMLHDGSGWGAMVGISAAVLAERGFTGAPAATVEAPEAARHWHDLGALWQVEHQYIKPYPICRWSHAAIDATRALCRDNDLKPEQISRIHVNSFRYAAELFRGMPDTTSKAQYSLPFAVAVMAQHEGHTTPKKPAPPTQPKPSTPAASPTPTLPSSR